MFISAIHHYRSHDETLVECLERLCSLTSAEAESLAAFGAVYVDRLRAISNRPLQSGQSIRVHLKPKRFPVNGIDWRAAIIHDCDEFVVVNKPAGVPVHATLDNRIENVLYQLGGALGLSLRITQRLDTDVSGLIVIAKTHEFQRHFNQLLVERSVKKRYRALVTAAPAPGRYVHYMERSARSPKTISTENREDWLPCVLNVLNVVPRGNMFDLEIDLETGRTHQIRAQLAAIGVPIVGDTLYQGVDSPLGIQLFSAAVSWVSDGNTHSFELAPPFAGMG